MVMIGFTNGPGTQSDGTVSMNPDFRFIVRELSRCGLTGTYIYPSPFIELTCVNSYSPKGRHVFSRRITTKALLVPSIFSMKFVSMS